MKNFSLLANAPQDVRTEEFRIGKLIRHAEVHFFRVEWQNKFATYRNALTGIFYKGNFNMRGIVHLRKSGS